MLLTRADLLTSGFAFLLAVAGLLRYPALPGPGPILRMAAVGLVPLGIAVLRKRVPAPGKALAIVFDFYFVATVLVIFDGLGPLIRAVHPVDRDAWLIAFDRWLFGADPTVALERFAMPLLSDVLTVCYALYYFHPIILGGLLFADDQRKGLSGAARTLPRYAFVMLLVFYVSYAGYFLLPAIGPRFTVTHAGPLPRGTVARVIDHTLDQLEKNKRDCFPSGHTMVVVAVLMEGARRSRRTFLAFLPFAIGLVIATVYGRYHYVADVLAGALLALVTVPIGRFLVGGDSPVGRDAGRARFGLE